MPLSIRIIITIYVVEVAFVTGTKKDSKGGDKSYKICFLNCQFQSNRIVMMKFWNADQCLNLPPSMNGGEFPHGCPGAVESNGDPSQENCAGGAHIGGAYPWWKDCCKWDGSKCIPKCNK